MRFDEAVDAARRARRRAPPRRHVLVPAHRPVPGEDERPHARRRRAAVAGCAPSSRTRCSPTPPSAWSTGSARASRATTRAAQPGDQPRAGAAAPTPTARERVFVASRRVRFREMEYSLPREVGMTALARGPAADRAGRAGRSPSRSRCARRRRTRRGCPRRTTATRSTSPSTSASGVDHRDYFIGVERVLRAYGGRPHWGKLHTRTAADLAPDVPRWDDFAAVRDRVDPDRRLRQRLPRPGPRLK